jgi:hypothetical protein
MACEPFMFGDHPVIICGSRRTMGQKCDYCGHWSRSLCDHPVRRGGKRTSCDRKLCPAHRRTVGHNAVTHEDVDLCPAHATLYELNGFKFLLGAVDLDPARKPVVDSPAEGPTESGQHYHVSNGEGWLSKKGTNGRRAWIADRSKAEVFFGGLTLDVSLRTHRLQAFPAGEEMELF